MENRPKPPQNPAVSESEDSQREVARRDLVNQLNHLHFNNGLLTVHLRETQRKRIFVLSARSEPCNGDWLDCRWVNQSHLPARLTHLQVESIRIESGSRLVSFRPHAVHLTREKLGFRLPAVAYQSNTRSHHRRRAHSIRAQLIQNGITCSGKVQEFSPLAFRVELDMEHRSPRTWLNPQMPVVMTLSDEHELLYSGLCKIQRRNGDQRQSILVLEPQNRSIKRFPAKQYRSIRQTLQPAPHIVFRHPLSGQLVDLKVLDISGSGFAVEENNEYSTLFPGLILPMLEVVFGNGFRISARAQVLYRRTGKGGESSAARCGAAFLDMEPHHQSQLLGILIQAQNPNVYLAPQVELDELWGLFFESGFIYPKKYVNIQNRREEFYSIYRKLYSQDLPIARHLVYRDRGVLLSHLAMLRFYDRAWMIHHLAARASGSKHAGMAVLTQISRFVNEVHRLPSAKLDYVFCYYRPTNQFPSRVFGGAQKAIGDPRGCSVYPFAYLKPLPGSAKEPELESPWELQTATPESIRELEALFGPEAGVLLTEAFDLHPTEGSQDEVAAGYAQVGFRRDRALFVLSWNDCPQVLFVVDITEPGLNLADLTSSIKAFILEPEEVPGPIFQAALSALSTRLDCSCSPVMVYPETYARQQELEIEKHYHLWILDLEYLDLYFRYCSKFNPGS